jgi:hypothetical protein
MDKLTTITEQRGTFRAATPMPRSKSVSTQAVSTEPPWFIMSTNQMDKVVVRVVTRKTRLRRDTTTSNEP